MLFKVLTNGGERNIVNPIKIGQKWSESEIRLVVIFLHAKGISTIECNDEIVSDCGKADM